MKPVTYKIDASGKTLGRVASDAAQALMGKKSVHYVKNEVMPVTVIVENAAKLSIPERRRAEKSYTHYTGYPGGLRTQSLPQRLDKKGIAFVLRKTILGMIPRNKMRDPRMKKLTIKI